MNLSSRLALGLAAATLLAGGCITGGTKTGGDLSSGGSSSLGLFLESLSWGRLVDVYDVNGTLVDSDVVINHLLDSDGVNYELATNPVSQAETLTILQTSGTTAFTSLLNTAKSNLQTVTPKKATGAPPMTMVARNAALRLQFSEHVDPSTVDFTTVQVHVGEPPVVSFTGRYVVDNDATSGKGIVIFNSTVSAIEAATYAIPQNSFGFPASLTSESTNIAIRIPTVPDPISGQPQVLTSLEDGKRPSVADADTEPYEEFITGKRILVRAARAGNQLDAYRGFLRDTTRPSLVGVQSATISTVAVATSSTVDFIYSLDSTRCRPMAPKVGDIFEVGDGMLMVTHVLNSSDPANYSVRSSIEIADSSFTTGATSLEARYTTRYSPVDADVQVCYLDIQPPPATADYPVANIDPTSTVTVRFDEPIDPGTMRSQHSFTVISPDDTATGSIDTQVEIEAAWFRQIDTDESVGEFIDRQRGYDYRPTSSGVSSASEFGGRILFGGIEPTDGSRVFTLNPAGGWNDPGPDNQFVVALRDGADGIKDLSGNPIDLSSFVAGNDTQSHQISTSSLTTGVNYLSLRGLSLDENHDGLAEWAGQVKLVNDGELTGRVPERFSRSADNTSAAISNRPLGAQIAEPLTPAGAVMMGLYRVHDFGFGYIDPSEYNLTVTGMSWAPAGGVTYDEAYQDISLSLAHSKYQPDEFLDLISGNPVYPASGLVTSTFDDNILGYVDGQDTGVDEVEVFRDDYYPKSVNIYVSSGVRYLPWPEFTADYLWRDTSIPQDYLGGASSSFGVPDFQWHTDTGYPFVLWAPEEAPSVALPLLTRFRTYPQSNTLGLNSAITTAIVPPGLTPPYSPICRIYSIGGQNSNSEWVQVQPDNPAKGGTRPTGGFQVGGSPTPSIGDELISWARADFALDVSRIYSHWFDLGATLNTGDSITILVEPTEAEQPEGTSLVVEFRGCSSISHWGDPDVNPSALTSADTPFDDYGDYALTGGSVSTPSVWTTDFTDLEDQAYRYFQVRITFNSNAEQGLRPTLDALGIVWGS